MTRTPPLTRLRALCEVYTTVCTAHYQMFEYHLTAKFHDPRLPMAVWRMTNRSRYIAGCWIWLGKRNQGQGALYKSKALYRLAYERMRGPIPEGMAIDHLCHQPACINPGHLDCIGLHENQRRGKRHWSRRQLVNDPRRKVPHMFNESPPVYRPHPMSYQKGDLVWFYPESYCSWRRFPTVLTSDPRTLFGHVVVTHDGFDMPIGWQKTYKVPNEISISDIEIRGPDEPITMVPTDGVQPELKPWRKRKKYWYQKPLPEPLPL